MTDVLAVGVDPMTIRHEGKTRAEDRLKKAAGKVMATPQEGPSPDDVAEAQQALVAKAAEIRAPFLKRVERSKSAA